MAEQDDSLHPLQEQAVFGAEVEHFLTEDSIGQYLIDRAKKDLEQASEALITVDPHDPVKIGRLQMDARVAQRVRSWLAEAIENGRNARVMLQAERDGA